MARTILVVEDSKSVRTALRWVLRKSGDTVVTATGFNEGKGHDIPDVAIVDYHLPDGSAVDLAKHFRDAGAATIVLGGDYHSFTPAPFEAVGVRHILRKPFRSDDVLNAIEVALSGAAPEITEPTTEEAEPPQAAAEPARSPGQAEEAEAEPTRLPPPPPSGSEDEPRPARGTMALKGMPRPTESALEESQTDEESSESAASATPTEDVAATTEEAAPEPPAAPRTPASPTAVTNAMDTSDVAAEDVAEGAVVAAPVEAEAAESPADEDDEISTVAEEQETPDVESVSPAPAAQAAAASAEVDVEELREMVRGMVQNEIANAVQNLVEDGLDARLPALVKDAIREMLREELNEKVVGYAKRKIDAFASNDLPRIAARVVERKSQ